MASCDKCVEQGKFWDGEPTGQEIKHDGIDAYVATPKSDTKKAILFIPDIQGWTSTNNRLLIDKYAEKGYLAILPDYFGDNPPPLKKYAAGDKDAFLAWIASLGPEITVPLAEKFLEYLRSRGATSIGVAAYCWGGRSGVWLAATDKIQALVVNHGSFIKNEEMEKVKQPSLFNCSENDPHIAKERIGVLEKILSDNKVPNDFKFYFGCTHGWTCRGDNGDAAIAKAIADAFERGIAWLTKYL